MDEQVNTRLGYHALCLYDEWQEVIRHVHFVLTVKQPGTQVTVAMQMACRVVVVHVCVGGGDTMFYTKHAMFVSDWVCASVHFTWSLVFTEHPCSIKSCTFLRSPSWAAANKACFRPCTGDNAASTKLKYWDNTLQNSNMSCSSHLLAYVRSSASCVVNREPLHKYTLKVEWTTLYTFHTGTVKWVWLPSV